MIPAPTSQQRVATLRARLARLAAVALLACTLAPAGPAGAQEADEPQQPPPPAPPIPDDLRAIVVFNPLVYGEPTYVNGILRGVDQANQVIALEEAPFPFGTFAVVATTRTDPGGYFSFKRRPALVTRWRVVSRTRHPGTSAEVQADVAPRLRMAVALRRRVASYRGSLAPRHDRAPVQIQRRGRSGGWTTIATARLRGTAFAGRVRVRGRTVLRAFFAGDGDHLPASTRPVTLDP